MVDNKFGKGYLKFLAFEGNDCFFNYSDDCTESIKVDESRSMIYKGCEELFSVIRTFATLLSEKLTKLGDGFGVRIESLKEFDDLALI